MKKTTGKIMTAALASVMLVTSVGFAGCAEPDLRIFNCYDYIDETLVDKFVAEYKEATGESIKVQYSCFDTPEDCYNALKIDGDAYDLVCPSDYMIEKMAREGMLEEIELPANGAYNTNVSPFIKDKFQQIAWDGKSLANYAAGYMWGTLGLVYNAETVDAEDMKSWSSLWLDKYYKKFSIKDSVRDTYFVGLAKHSRAALLEYKAAYENGGSLEDYQNSLKAAFNDTAAATVNAVKSDLISLKEKSKGMEVDNGKDDIIKGDIDIYFAWSGDAVYAMDEAESEDLAESDRKELYYSVPEEGSNVWFDGWCVPKDAKNKELALKFIDFISTPENVITNMEYIGYVSCISGGEIFDWVTETYGEENGEFQIDLSYFFGGTGRTVATNTLGRQFSAQYPTQEIINRCVVMNYFPDADNERITNMWNDIKAE